MKIFADANILVSVLNREYPLFPLTSRILSLADRPPFRIYTSPVCLAIAFYFAEKKYKAVAKKYVRESGFVNKIARTAQTADVCSPSSELLRHALPRSQPSLHSVADKPLSSASVKVRILCEHIEMAEINAAAAKAALSNPAVKDLEDGLEYYAAIDAGCDCILTEDKNGFYYSSIEVLTALEFYEKYMRKKK